MRVTTEVLLPARLKKLADLSRKGDPKLPNNLTSGNLPLPFDHPQSFLRMQDLNVRPEKLYHSEGLYGRAMSC